MEKEEKINELKEKIDEEKAKRCVAGVSAAFLHRPSR